MTRPDVFRIILTEDGGQLSGWPELPTEATIESFIADYAGQGVDVLSYGLLGTHLAIYDSDVVIRQHEELPPDPALENMRHLSRCGIDYPAIVAATSHRLGMQFWPTARLNNTGGVYSSLHDEHPEWFFAGYANMYGFTGGYRPMINYEIAVVRAFCEPDGKSQRVSIQRARARQTLK